MSGSGKLTHEERWAKIHALREEIKRRREAAPECVVVDNSVDWNSVRPFRAPAWAVKRWLQ